MRQTTAAAARFGSVARVCGAVLAIALGTSAFGAEPKNPGDNAGTSPSPPASLSEHTRILERFPVQDDTVTVSITVMHDDDEQGPDSTVTSIRIANRRGGELYREEIPTYVKDDRLWDETLVSVYRFEWRGRLGFRLDQESLPCYPSSACASSMYFLIRGGGVERVSSWSDVFSESDSEHASWSGRYNSWFDFVVPMRARFDRPSGGFEPAPELASTDTTLAVLETYASRNATSADLADSVRTVRLYHSPTGDAFDEVGVSPSMNVTFGSMWARVTGTCAGCIEASDDFDVEFLRLEVFLDGHRGFVQEQDFAALGLVQAG